MSSAFATPTSLIVLSCTVDKAAAVCAGSVSSNPFGSSNAVPGDAIKPDTYANKYATGSVDRKRRTTLRPSGSRNMIRQAPAAPCPSTHTQRESPSLTREGLFHEYKGLQGSGGRRMVEGEAARLEVALPNTTSLPLGEGAADGTSDSAQTQTLAPQTQQCNLISVVNVRVLLALDSGGRGSEGATTSGEVKSTQSSVSSMSDADRDARGDCSRDDASEGSALTDALSCRAAARASSSESRRRLALRLIKKVKHNTRVIQGHWYPNKQSIKLHVRSSRIFLWRLVLG